MNKNSFRHNLVRAMALLVASCASIAAEEVVPDFYKEAGLSPNRGYVNQSANEYIDPFTGALQQHYVDIHIPGDGGFDLNVVRSYNSSSASISNYMGGLAGVGWTVHFGRVVKRSLSGVGFCSNTNQDSQADNPVLELPDGSRQILTFVSPQTLVSVQRWKMECLNDGIVVHSPDGTRYDMKHIVQLGTDHSTAAWYTSRITDKNGNFADVLYTEASSPEINRIATSDGREVTFAYKNVNTTPRLIESISGDGGQTYQYYYRNVPGAADQYFLTGVERPDGTSWNYDYYGNLGANAGSYLLRQTTHPEGGTVAYNYGYVDFDSTNLYQYLTAVTKKTTSDGGTWVFAYNPGSPSQLDVTTVTTPAGRIVYKHVGAYYAVAGKMWTVGLLMEKVIGDIQHEYYAWDKQVLSSENYWRPGQFATKFDQETNAPLLREKKIIRDGQTYVTSYSNFDGYGNPTAIAESGPNGGDRTTQLTYFTSPGKWIVRQVKDEVSSAGAIYRQFDAAGNMQSVKTNGVTTGYVYFGNGNVKNVTFPRSQRHDYQDYKRGIARIENQPEAVTIKRSVSDAGNIESQTDGDNHTTRYAYDGLNRVRLVDYPIGNSVTISYTRTKKTATRGNLQQTVDYDGFGNPVSVVLGGIHRTLRWDPVGRKTFESNPGSSNGDTYEYDILGRIRKIKHADNTFKTISYGAGTMQVTDERSKTTAFKYRAYGNPDKAFLISVTAAESSASVAIERYPDDLVKSVTQGGYTRTYIYNEKKFLTSVSNPETGTTSYGRDDAGNMTSLTIGGKTTFHSYDDQNRVESTTFPAGTPAVNFGYWKNGQLKSVSSSVAVRTFDYDANDNLKSDSLEMDGVALAIGYEYDANDHLASITYPRTKHVVNYSPDALGRPTEVSGYVSGVTYWPSGQVRRIAYKNGVVTEYGQDSNRLWPNSLSTSRGATRYLDSSYAYDAVGNLSTINDSVDSSYNRQLDYDNINRLISAKGPWGTGSISYDGTGNIQKQQFGSSTLTYSYDGSNRLSDVRGTRTARYTYDSYGDIASAGSTSYRYDGAQNLVAVNGGDISYAYDGLNRRVLIAKDGFTTREVYDRDHKLLTEYTPANADKLIEYVYLGDKRIAQRQIDRFTKTSVTASLGTCGVKQSVTLTAAVSGNNPEGTVTFKSGTSVLGTAAVAAGQATLSVKLGAVGEHSVTATYGGDSDNAPSTSAPITLTVNQHTATTVSVSGLPNPVGLNLPVALTASVAGSEVSGSVTFLEGETVLGTATVVDGQASAIVAFGSMGNHGVSAVYSGDEFNTPASSPLHPLGVNEKTTSHPALLVSPNPVTINQDVTMVAAVTGSNPSGSVTLSDNGAVVGSATLSEGRAAFTRRYATEGTHQLKISYSGDVSNSGGVSPVVALTVRPKATSVTTLALDPDLVGVNRAVSLRTTVEGVAPTGTVTFRDGATDLMSVSLSNGQAAFTTVFSSIGSHALSATYNGDESNKESTSPSATLNVVNGSATSTTWRTVPRPNVVVGSVQTLAASVTKNGGGALPCSGNVDCYGKVLFLDGATVIANVGVDINGMTPAVTWIPAGIGVHTLTAKYVGTGASSPSEVAYVVNVRPALATQTTLNTFAWPGTVGITRYVFAEVSSVEGSHLLCDGTQNCSLGVVQFLVGTSVLGEGAVGENGFVWMDWTPTETGPHTITARFLGTTTMEPSSTAATVSVKAAEPTLTTWLRQPTSTTVGTSQSLVAKLALVSGDDLYYRLHGYPGKIEFLDGSDLIGEGEVSTSGVSVSVNWVPTTAGEHAITARYTGSLSVEPSEITSTVTVSVTEVAATKTTIDPAPAGTRLVGTVEILTARVEMESGGALVCDRSPECNYGKVRFFDGSAVIGEAAVEPDGRSANVAWAPATPGAHTVTARYLGTMAMAESAGDAQVEVTGALPTITNWVATSTPITSTVGVGRTLSVRVDLASGNPLVCGGAPQCDYGVVRFREDRTIIGEGRVASDGTVEPVTWVPLTDGAHVITAQYMGNVAMAPSAADHTISATGSLTTKTTWTPSPSPSRTMGTAQQLLAKVTRLDGWPLVCDTADPCSYGTVRFLDGNTLIGESEVTSGGGVAPVTWAPAAAGSHTITAQYVGNLKVPGSARMGNLMLPSQTSATIDVSGALATGMSWTTAPSARVVGAAQTLVAKLALSDGGQLVCDQTQNCSYGAVTFLDGATVIGEGTVNSGGAVTPITWIPRTAGAHTITARFLGTTPLAPSAVSATVTLPGAVETRATWAVVPAATQTVGTAQQLKARVALSAGGALICDATQDCIYGAVQFLDGGAIIGEGAVGSNGDAAPVTWTPATGGSHTLTAQYLGTTTMAASAASANVNVTDALATTTSWLAAPPSTVVAGTSRALSVYVKLQRGGSLVCDQTAGCTYGKVSFLDGETLVGEGLVNANGSVPSVTWTANIAGARTITAQYQGTTPLAPSSITAEASVSTVATATRWLIAPNASVTVGTGNRVRVAVNQASGARLVCDGALGCTAGSYGSVRFTDNGTEVAVKGVSFDAVAGAHVAETDWVPTTSGAHSITAEYLGTGTDLPSSVTGSSTVTGAASTTTMWIQTPQAQVALGSQLTLMVQVMPALGGTLKCDATLGCSGGSYGKIRFSDGESVLGDVDVGVLGYAGASYLGAQIQWTPASFGARTVTATYLGTVPNAASSVAAQVTVAKVATETHWVSAPATGVPGAGQAISVRVAESGGGRLQGGGGAEPDYGTAEFFDGDTSIGSVALQPVSEGGTSYLGAGVIWLPQTPGVRTVTARYSGTARNQASEVSASVEIVGDRYTIGGSVRGLTGNGLVLRNGADALSIGANGNFTFAQGVAPGADYSVSVAVPPTAQQCTVTNGSGAATANVTNISVECRSPRNWGSAFLIGNPEWAEDHDPQVAADPAGNAIVTWSSGYSYASVNRYAVGTGWGGPQDISNTEFSTNPRAAMDAQGNGFVAWSTVQFFNYSCSGRRSNDLRVQYFPADGSAPTQEVFPVYDIGLPGLAVGPNGNVSLVGVQLGGEDCYGGIYEWRYTPGFGWGAQQPVSAGDWPGRSKLAFDAAGSAYAISWGIHDQRICWNTDRGTGWGTPNCDISNDADAILPDMAVDGSGNMLVVYQEDNGAGWEIWARRYEGGVWLDEELIEDTSSTYAFVNDPRVAMDASGNAIAVWSQSDEDAIFHIWANRYTVGQGWGTPTRLESNPDDALNPQIAFDPSGDATVIWEQGHQRDDLWTIRIWTMRNVDGEWQLPETIDDGEGDSHRPQLTFDGQGNAIAVWEREGPVGEDNWGTNVWGNRYE